jgi:hypothetical protein
MLHENVHIFHVTKKIFECTKKIFLSVTSNIFQYDKKYFRV